MLSGKYTGGVQWHIVLDGVPETIGKGKIKGPIPDQNVQLLSI